MKVTRAAAAKRRRLRSPRYIDASGSALCYSKEAEAQVQGFFARHTSHHDARARCDQLAASLFPGIRLDVAKSQGYCSYTISVSGIRIVQFRPESFKLDLTICGEAKDIFGDRVPSTAFVGSVSCASASGHPATLYAYVQEEIAGLPLAKFDEARRSEAEFVKQRRQLVADLADVFAISYLQGRLRKRQKRNVRKGRVGSTLNLRLGIVEGGKFRESICKKIARIREGLAIIEELPWCLTHGDLIPTNILVDARTGRLAGFIDWTEGEWLPFGVGLYGLEDLLVRRTESGRLRLTTGHNELRDNFWETFFAKVLSSKTADACAGGGRTELSRGAVEMARDLGVLLWHGIAFDDGRLDRAVAPGRDDAEIEKLELFLCGVEDPVSCASWEHAERQSGCWPIKGLVKAKGFLARLLGCCASPCNRTAWVFRRRKESLGSQSAP